jgi:adenine-specific DNA-methyltransferase
MGSVELWIYLFRKDDNEFAIDQVRISKLECPGIGETTMESEEAWAGLKPLVDRKFRIRTNSNYVEEFDVLVANNDVLEFISTVPNGVFQLIVTSPPYNIGKPYEKRQEFIDYLGWQEKVVRECIRTLKTGGSLCWQVGNYVENGEVFPLDTFFYNIIKQNPELHLRNRIIWFFEHGLHATKRLSGRYETILWFSKGDSYLFNLDRIRVPQKYPGKTYFKGPKHGKPSSNPLGKNPGDVWKIQCAEDWETLLWDIPNVKANHPEKTIHPAQFPIELVERLVLALTNPKDIVFDPFAGAGSSLLAALLHDRRAVGVDKEKAYVEVALTRIQKLSQGKLRYRPLGTRKYEPSGREKVSKVPKEWWSK